jgi:hypothetical protein
MPAGVGERANGIRAIADENDRISVQVGGEIIAAGGNLIDTTDKIPRLSEDVSHLLVVKLLRGVAPSRQGLGLRQRKPRFRIQARLKNVHDCVLPYTNAFAQLSSQAPV